MNSNITLKFNLNIPQNKSKKNVGVKTPVHIIQDLYFIWQLASYFTQTVACENM